MEEEGVGAWRVEKWGVSCPDSLNKMTEFIKRRR